jgi:hypothetical protein
LGSAKCTVMNVVHNVAMRHTLGLYSAFLACRAIVFRSRRQSKLTVATMFLEHAR